MQIYYFSIYLIRIDFIYMYFYLLNVGRCLKKDEFRVKFVSKKQIKNTFSKNFLQMSNVIRYTISINEMCKKWRGFSKKQGSTGDIHVLYQFALSGEKITFFRSVQFLSTKTYFIGQDLVFKSVLCRNTIFQYI